MGKKGLKKMSAGASGEELINDLIKDAEEQGMTEAVTALKEFKEMLKNEKFKK